MTSSELGKAAARQAELNRGTRDARDRYRPHRERVTELAVTGPLGAAAVLGAGNCNDVDLGALAARFSSIDLVDVDADALAAAAEREPEDVRARLTLHGAVDVSGLLAAIDAGASVDALEALAAKGTVLPRAGLSLCLSSCLLTQMILSVVERIGPRHPRAVEVVRALRGGHFASIARALAPGGMGLVVTDVVSSDTAPGLGEVPAPRLGAKLKELVTQGNFFTGANPFAIEAALRATPSLREVALHGPWLWRIGERRTALVVAASFRV